MARSPLFSKLRRALRLAWARESLGPERVAAELERGGLSRRELLGGTLAAATLVGLPLGGCGGSDAGSGARVAVVGAGMAGLHCAWRLQQAGVRATVYEASGRAGGRISTARGMFADGQVGELGGELIDSNHVSMLGLAMELGIPVDDLFADEPPGLVRDTWHLEGRHVGEGEIIAAFMPVAARMAETVMAAEADDAEFERVDGMSIPEWLEQEGQASPLLRRLLEAAFTGEYGLEAAEQSIFNLLYLIDYEAPAPFRIFGDSDERYHVHTGNDTLTGRLADALAAALELDTRLVAIAETGSGLRLTVESGGAAREETFDHVVLALPFTLLREVDLAGVTLTPEKRQVIQELGYGTNAKLMGGFATRVWREQHNASGSAITDNGLQFLWDTSRGQDGPNGLLTWFAGGATGVAMGDGTAEERMQAVLPLVDEIFADTSGAYQAGSAVRMHWPTAPFTKGSYACYRVGQWAFYGLEGERAGNLHFCGEHCSLDFQGFMEGACETGALAAMEVLDDLAITPPAASMRWLAGKLALPQASYHGDRRRRLRWQERRRIVRSETGRRRF